MRILSSAPRPSRSRPIIAPAKVSRQRPTAHPAPKPKGTVAFVSHPWSRVPAKALVDFTRSFAVMLRARLPLVQSLETAARQCKNTALKHVLEVVRRDVERGASLSESLARHEHVFNRLYVHLARVGELAGILDEILLRLATHLEKTAALKRKVCFALFYPGLILTVAIGATLFFLTAIVPTFAEMYADFDQELPGPTQVVLRLSQALTDYFLVVILGTGGSAVGIVMLLRTPRGQLTWDRVKLRSPLLGSLMQRSLTARFCRTLGTLLMSGVALVDALSILAKASGNRCAEHALTEVLGRVSQGSNLYQPLKQAGLFPDMVVQLIAVGEQTAELDGMLLHAAEHYEEELDVFLDGLTSILEPVLIIMIGLMLGGILVALYLPMFELINTVG